MSSSRRAFLRVAVVLIWMVAALAVSCFGVLDAVSWERVLQFVVALLLLPLWALPSVPDVLAGGIGVLDMGGVASYELFGSWGGVVFFVLRGALSAYVGYSATFVLRSGFGWSAVSFILGPAVGGVMLPIASVPHKAVLAKQRLDAVRARHPDQSEKNLRVIAVRDTSCANCGALINLHTGEGLESVESTPWVMRCSSCHREVDVAP